MLSSGNHDSELQNYDPRFSNKHSLEEDLAYSHTASPDGSSYVCPARRGDYNRRHNL